MPASTVSTSDTEKHVTIIAGEASGDMHAANLVKALKTLDPSVTFSGMGGNKMKQSGVNLYVDATDLAVVGLIEVLAKYGQIKKALNTIKDRLSTNPPDLLILIDYQEFNQKLAAFAKSIGIKVLFYIGPQVWAWRPNRIYKMAKIVDHMAVILPFEVALYKKANVKVTFTGHPLVDEVNITQTTEQARKSLSLANETTIGLFPGSRSGEITKILPTLLKTATLLKHERPDLQFVLAVASSLCDDDFNEYQQTLNALNIQLISDYNYDVMQSCDAIITASGTATLEIGLMEKPMAIVYKISAISFAILKRMVKLKHVGLVNIISGKEVIREFIQTDAKPNDIAEEILKILNNKTYNQTMRENLSKLRHKLGVSGGSNNVAKLALQMLNHE